MDFTIIGAVVIGIVGIFAIAVAISMFVCSREVIEDKSSSEDLKSLFPEVTANKDEHKEI